MKRSLIARAGMLAVLALACLPALRADGPDELAAIRKAIAEHGARWVAVDNPFFRLSMEDKRAMLNQTVPSAAPGDPWFEPDLNRTLPAALDWRNNVGNYVTPVRNQGSCGSCWAFAAVASAEARHAVRNHLTDPLLDLSEQKVLSCTGLDDNCDGGRCSNALTFLSESGTPDEACFPYVASKLLCEDSCVDWADRAVRIQSWSLVTRDDFTSTDLIKNALLDGPVSTWFQVYQDFFAYGGGVYQHVWGSPISGHYVLIVGWDDATQAWLVKNSWGESWGGLGGYFWVAFAGAGCQFGTYTMAATAIPGGDLDHDGSVTAADLAIQQGYLAGTTLPGGTRRADCDTVTDGAINAADLVWEIQKLNGRIP